MATQSQPLLTAVTHRWESELAGRLGSSGVVHVARRCADLADLLGTVAAGLGRVAVVSSDLRGLDRAALAELAEHEVRVVGVFPPGDEAGERALRRWGVGVVLPADADLGTLETALQEVLADGPEVGDDWDAAAADLERGSGTGEGDAAGARGPRAADGGGGAPEPTPGEPSPGAGVTVPGSRVFARDGGAVGAPEETGGAHGVTGPGERGKVLVVWGPAGSPGRTTVAVNLAAEMASPLAPVLLVDADTYAASVAQVLAVLDEAPGVAAAARAADQGTLDRDSLAGLAPEVLPGMRVLTGLPRADRWPELREHALADILSVCTELAPWTVVDVSSCLEQDEEVSFDTRAPRRNGAALAALEAADHVVVTGVADPVGLQRLVRGLDALGAVSRAPRTVLVTRVRAAAVGPDPGRRVTEALRRFAGVEQVHLVPDDRAAVDAALLAGRVLLEAAPTSPAREAMQDLAAELTGRPVTGRRSGVRRLFAARGRS